MLAKRCSSGWECWACAELYRSRNVEVRWDLRCQWLECKWCRAVIISRLDADNDRLATKVCRERQTVRSVHDEVLTREWWVAQRTGETAEVISSAWVNESASRNWPAVDYSPTFVYLTVRKGRKVKTGNGTSIGYFEEPNTRSRVNNTQLS